MNHTELFNKIAQVVPTINGWATVEKAQTLASIIIATHPRVIVEVGVFAGASAIPMGLACNHVDCGHIHAVDAWSNELAIKNEVKDHVDWWKAVNFDDIHNEFLGHIKSNGLISRFTVHRADSCKVAPVPDIELMHLDGSHTDKAIDDMEHWGSNIVRGGFLVLDDLHWCSGAVMRVADLAKDMGFVERFVRVDKETHTQRDNDWMIMQRVK